MGRVPGGRHEVSVERQRIAAELVLQHIGIRIEVGILLSPVVYSRSEADSSGPCFVARQGADKAQHSQQLVELVVAVAAGPDPVSDRSAIRREATGEGGRIDHREAGVEVHRRGDDVPLGAFRQRHRAQVDIERAGQVDGAGAADHVGDPGGPGPDVVNASGSGTQHPGTVHDQARVRTRREVTRPGIGRVVEPNLLDVRGIAIERQVAAPGHLGGHDDRPVVGEQRGRIHHLDVSGHRDRVAGVLAVANGHPVEDVVRLHDAVRSFQQELALRQRQPCPREHGGLVGDIGSAERVAEGDKITFPRQRGRGSGPVRAGIERGRTKAIAGRQLDPVVVAVEVDVPEVVPVDRIGSVRQFLRVGRAIRLVVLVRNHDVEVVRADFRLEIEELPVVRQAVAGTGVFGVPAGEFIQRVESTQGFLEIGVEIPIGIGVHPARPEDRISGRQVKEPVLFPTIGDSIAIRVRAGIRISRITAVGFLDLVFDVVEIRIILAGLEQVVEILQLPRVVEIVHIGIEAGGKDVVGIGLVDELDIVVLTVAIGIRSERRGGCVTEIGNLPLVGKAVSQTAVVHV